MLENELALGLGVTGLGYTHAGGRWGDLFVNPVVEGRLLLSGFTAEGSIAFAMPSAREGPAMGFTTTARMGWTGRRWSVVTGPSIQHARGAKPSEQILPSVRAQLSFGGWGLTAGLVDHQALALAHLTVDVGDMGVGYVAPFGAVFIARFRWREYVGIKITALAFRIGNSDVAMFTIAATAGPTSGKPRTFAQAVASPRVAP